MPRSSGRVGFLENAIENLAYEMGNRLSALAVDSKILCRVSRKSSGIRGEGLAPLGIVFCSFPFSLPLSC